MSFRNRLLLASSATLALVIGVLLIFANLLLATQVQHEASSVLEARAQAQIAALSVAGGQIRERATPNESRLDRAAWIFAAGRLIERPPDASPSLTAAAVALSQRGPGERDGPSGQRLRADPVYAGRPRRQVGTVVVGYTEHPLRVLQAEVLLGSIVFAVLALIGGALVVGRTIRRALEPVAVMTKEAEDWSAHDLERRFDLGPVQDELTGLGAVLDGLLSRIAASRHHERRFASDTAHELRTPLAAIRGWAELALTGPGGTSLDETERAPLEAIIAQVDRMERTVWTLLEVARRELEGDAGTTELTPLLTQLEDVVLTADADLPAVEGEAEVLRQILAPLIENARRYAVSSVRVQAHCAAHSVLIAVRDDGPGVDPELAETVFEPGVLSPGGSGAGLGLALARRLARSCGGDITLGPGPGGNFIVELAAVGRPVAPTRSKGPTPVQRQSG